MKLAAAKGGGDPYVAYDHFMDRYLRGKVAVGLPALLFRKDGVYYYGNYDGLWGRFHDLWVPEGLAELLSDRDLAVAVLLPPEPDESWWNRLKLLLDPRHLRRFVEQGESAPPGLPVRLRAGGRDLELVGAAGSTARDVPSGRELSASFIVKPAAGVSPSGAEEVNFLQTERSAVGYVVDAGIGLIRARLNLNSPYLVVAEGAVQADRVKEAGVPAAKILVLFKDPEERAALIARGFPGDNLFTADGFADWSAARRHIWNTAFEWMKIIEGAEATLLLTTARTLLGLVTQLKELLPLEWQGAVTEESAEQVLFMYQLGV